MDSSWRPYLKFIYSLGIHLMFRAILAPARVLAPKLSTFLRAFRSAASSAQRQVRRAVELLASKSIVARRNLVPGQSYAVSPAPG